MKNNSYPANFTKASLLIPESRIIAELMLKHPTPAEWKQQIFDENILQRRTPNSASTVASLIRSRLNTMDERLWGFIQKGSKELATQAILAATVKYSPLLGDFLREVYQRERKQFAEQLRSTSWDQFIEDCHNRVPDLPVRSESTHAKLKQNAFRMMAEAGLIEDTKSMAIRHMLLAPELKRYLVSRKEDYVLKCLVPAGDH
ncbi:MAG: DUF1819 family protein [Endozoicomonas sp.]|uniref:DUF1819 family protein n=1 Tax=Endozoicomonas sp. TaxID=1892382 RepID=UPI003D9B3EB6